MIWVPREGLDAASWPTQDASDQPAFFVCQDAVVNRRFSIPSCLIFDSSVEAGMRVVRAIPHSFVPADIERSGLQLRLLLGLRRHARQQECEGSNEPAQLVAEPRLGRRMVLTFPLLPPPQKN